MLLRLPSSSAVTRQRDEPAGHRRGQEPFDERRTHDAKVQVDLVRIRTGMQRALNAVEARGYHVTSVAVAEELEAAQVRERGRVTLRENQPVWRGRL